MLTPQHGIETLESHTGLSLDTPFAAGAVIKDSFHLVQVFQGNQRPFLGNGSPHQSGPGGGNSHLDVLAAHFLEHSSQFSFIFGEEKIIKGLGGKLGFVRQVYGILRLDGFKPLDAFHPGEFRLGGWFGLDLMHVKGSPLILLWVYGFLFHASQDGQEVSQVEPGSRISIRLG